MLIEGLQKLTLLDYPGRTACTLFTYGCNLRCPFCHNATLVTSPRESNITEEDFFAFLGKRKNIIDGVCVTGGEPMLQKDILGFLSKIKDLGLSIKLDTNGTFPDKLKQSVCDGLVDYVAMDIKNSPEKYAVTTGIRDFDIAPVMESASFLLEEKIPYEMRTTVTKTFHEEKDFDSIAKWIGKTDKYFLQNFVNSGKLIDETVCGYPAEDMKKLADYVKKLIPATELRGI